MISEDVRAMAEAEEEEGIKHQSPKSRERPSQDSMQKKKKKNRPPPPGIPEREIALQKMENRDLSLENLPGIKGWEILK